MESYVTLEEANTYVEASYMSTEQEYSYWNSLEDTDKTKLLNRASNEIDSIPYIGMKSGLDQERSFPRYPELEVSDKVKYAVIENAVVSLDNEARNVANMQSKGISKFTVGDFSESYSSNYMSNRIFISQKSKMYLSDYMSGGFKIECH